MPESSETPDADVPGEAGSSFITRTLEPLRKMTGLTKTVGVIGLVVITLLYYFGKNKVFKKR
jgi:hypothetical protein